MPIDNYYLDDPFDIYKILILFTFEHSQCSHPLWILDITAISSLWNLAITTLLSFMDFGNHDIIIIYGFCPSRQYHPLWILAITAISSHMDFGLYDIFTPFGLLVF